MRVVILDNLDQPNKNGHMYTTESIQKIIDDFKDKQVFGQLGIPRDMSSSIDLTQSTHYVTNLRIENNSLVGDIKIIKEPDVMEQFSHLQFGFRPTGFGKLKEDGTIYDYTLRSIDYVQNPS
jgi:hypothetical protein